jgi:transposase
MLMMGTQDKQQPLFYVGFDLDSRVGPEDPLRQVKQRIDFSFVRREVTELYGGNGHVSIDPEVILKLLFLLFFDDVKSERELMRQVGYRLDYMWFLDFPLDNPTPNHSVLSKARRRWGPEIFERLFVRTVQQCVAAGLVDGSKLHMDATFVDADASKDSVKKGSPELIEALRKAYNSQESKLDDVSDADCDSPDDQADDDHGMSTGASNDDNPSTKPLVNQTLLSTTDPDTAVVRQGKREPRPRYKHHRAVDDAHGVVTAMTTTAGDVNEAELLSPLIDQHEQNTKLDVDTVVADSCYGTIENQLACADRGIHGHMADLHKKQKGSGRRAGIFDQSIFIFDASSNTYTCPAGNRMHPRRLHGERQSWDYVTERGVCASCELRSDCTRSKTGRSIKRHIEQDRIDLARRRAACILAKRDRLRRKHLMEGSFAQGANNHHLKRSRWRRLWRQRIQDWLIASVQNIKLLITRSRRPLRSVMGVCATSLRATFAAQRVPAGHLVAFLAFSGPIVSLPAACRVDTTS